MTDYDPERFYRATQALKLISKYWEPRKTVERAGALTPTQIKSICKLITEGKRQAEIARMLQVAPSTVYNVERRHLRAQQA